MLSHISENASIFLCAVRRQAYKPRFSCACLQLSSSQHSTGTNSRENPGGALSAGRVPTDPSLPIPRGTIVKARDKLYHPECFMCDDCGLNLKQRGYFFIEEQLYCETHAKERVKPPEGYDVVAVYPNAKVELV